MKNIADIVNEERMSQYTVEFSGLYDEDEMPIQVTVSVPSRYAKKFEDYLNNESGNTIKAACGIHNNFELEY